MPAPSVSHNPEEQDVWEFSDHSTRIQLKYQSPGACQQDVGKNTGFNVEGSRAFLRGYCCTKDHTRATTQASSAIDELLHVWSHTSSKSMDQPDKVANPARGQLNRGTMIISLSSLAPENLTSRDGFGSPVPRQPAHLHTQAEAGAYLRDSSRVPRQHRSIYLIRHTMLSVKSRVYRITPLRTEGVHCREFAVTGPVNLKVCSKRVLP